MVTADYQEFANRTTLRCPRQYRDLQHARERQIRKSAKRCAIATPPNQHESGTSCPKRGGKETPLAAKTAVTAMVNANQPLRTVMLRGFRRGLFRALVDHLVHNTEVPGHRGGKELVAFQRVLDRLVGLPGVFLIDLVEPLLEVQDFLGMQHDLGWLAMKAAGW